MSVVPSKRCFVRELARKRTTHPFSMLAIGALLAIAAAGSSSCSQSPPSGQAPDPIVGAYQLVSLEEPGPDGTIHKADATGSLVLTREGRMSVQVMYAGTQTPTGPVQYAQGGYEASFGRYEV